ncbi:unnamed protein product [Closterium sp. NIES-54]
MYLMTCTRPDLAYPLSLLARYVAPARHRKVQWDAAKRQLRYLYSTSGMGLVFGGRGPVVLTGHADASWVDDSATQRSSQGYTFRLGSGSVSWRSTCSSSVLSSSCEAEIYAGAMATQELRWLTYLLTDLGEKPRSPPVLYVDNKAMIALCQEHRLEHRTKHISLRYFLARELQQRGQLRLAYAATRANTADIFTKALPPGLVLVPNFCSMHSFSFVSLTAGCSRARAGVQQSSQGMRQGVRQDAIGRVVGARQGAARSSTGTCTTGMIGHAAGREMQVQQGAVVLVAGHSRARKEHGIGRRSSSYAAGAVAGPCEGNDGGETVQGARGSWLMGREGATKGVSQFGSWACFCHPRFLDDQ